MIFFGIDEMTEEERLAEQVRIASNELGVPEYIIWGHEEFESLISIGFHLFIRRMMRDN